MLQPKSPFVSQVVWNCKPDDGAGDDDEKKEEYDDDDDGDLEDEIVNEEQDGNLYPKWCGIASIRFYPCSNRPWRD